MSWSARLATLASLPLVTLVLPPEVAAQETLAIDEWEVPWAESRPRDPYVAPDGRVWFVGQRSHYAAVLDPASGEFTRYDLLEGAGPHNLIVDDEGTVWYAGNADRHIGRLDPATGEIERFDMPDERARDPHTLLFGADDDIWFTVQGGNFVGHFDPSSGDVELVEAPSTEGRGGQPGSSRPYGIKLDSEGRPWIVLFNTNKVATVDPETMELVTFDLPDETTRPRRLEIDSRDDVWYVDYANGRLGRLDTDTGEVTEWDNPGGSDSRPYGMAIDADDRVWFVETGHQPNTFVGFDPATEEFFSITEVGSGGGAIRHMYYDADENVVWFGTDANTVGRATLPPLTRRVISQQ
ncbi:lyase [Gaopeijia maritima]|uniref:Vgb family protein n=1 Tax=Gaopeijia maritima TaxID=3119007 RepID=UPI003243F838